MNYTKTTKQTCYVTFPTKEEILESIRYVDQVVQADNFSPLQLLQDYAIDAYAVADEWLHTKEEEIAFMKSKVKRSSYFHVLKVLYQHLK